MLMVKISSDTLKMINKLPKKKKRRWTRLCVAIAACQRNGFDPENLDRVYIEAIEMIDLEVKFPEPDAEESRDWEPARHYDQYISPKAA